MSTVNFSGSNARLVYQQGGTHIAELRCKQLAINYGIVAEESHARGKRAFYPHRRVQGEFTMVFDFKGWREYNRGMAWFQGYFNGLLGWKNPTPMLVRMDSRDFLRWGIPTTGVAYGDHTGSMVFSPAITFVSVSDPNDPSTNILKTNQASNFQAQGPQSAQWFYPDSTLQRPGALQTYLYNQAQEAAVEKVGYVQNMVTGGRAFF